MANTWLSSIPGENRQVSSYKAAVCLNRRPMTAGPAPGHRQGASNGVTHSNRMSGQEGLGVDRFVDRRAR